MPNVSLSDRGIGDSYSCHACSVTGTSILAEAFTYWLIDMQLDGTTERIYEELMCEWRCFKFPPLPLKQNRARARVQASQDDVALL